MDFKFSRISKLKHKTLPFDFYLDNMLLIVLVQIQINCNYFACFWFPLKIESYIYVRDACWWQFSDVGDNFEIGDR